MAYTSYRASEAAGADFYAVDSVQTFALGTVLKGVDASLGQGEFIYLKGVASCVEGSFVTYSEKDQTAILLAANAIGSVGIAMAATVAGKFGWFQIKGAAVGKVAAAFADNGLVYATATAGTADDAAVAGDRVKCALGASAIDTPATGFAYIDIRYPWMDDATAA